jgi:ABC-type Fe3+-hydroxamate transport system substrate-binding protein
MGPRVVSLVPSVTETLLAWGIEPVGVTRFCEQGNRFPSIGGTKDPKLDEIVALRPDLVVVCDQENRLEDAAALESKGIAVHAIHCTDVDHVGPEMVRLASSVDADRALGEACAVDHRVNCATSRVRAYVPIWKRPWMALGADTYGASLLRAVGIGGIDADGDGRYPEIDLETARIRGAQLVIAPDEPYVFGERNRAELESVAPVVFVSGKDLFWWGVRTPAAIDRLRDALAV